MWRDREKDNMWRERHRYDTMFGQGEGLFGSDALHAVVLAVYFFIDAILAEVTAAGNLIMKKSNPTLHHW